MAAIAAQKMGAWASEASDRISLAATKVRSDHKESCDSLDNMCSGVAAVAAAMWASIVDLATSPFFPYLLVTFVLNIPPFAYGLASVFSYDCNGHWLVFNAFLSILHMMIAVYTVYRIRKNNKSPKPVYDDDGIRVSAAGDDTTGSETPYVQAGVNTSNNNNDAKQIGGAPDSWERIRIVMCYDMVMAIYYILCLVWAIWQGIGTTKIINGEFEQVCGRWVLLSVVCGFLYMGLGVVAWTFSLCFLRYKKLNSQQSSLSKEVLAVDDNGRISLA